MRAAWGNKWCTHLDADNISKSLEIWYARTADLTDEQISKAIVFCENNCDYPPSIATFKKAALGIVSVDRAWELRETDEIAKKAYAICDDFLMRTSSISDAKKIFAASYQNLSEQLLLCSSSQ